MILSYFNSIPNIRHHKLLIKLEQTTMKLNLVHNNNEVGSLEEMYLMRDENARAAAHVAVDAALEQLPAHVRVHCR